MSIEKKIILGVSGTPGSYSEIAASVYAERRSIPVAHIAFSYLRDAKGVLRALSRGKIRYGIVPVWNSGMRHVPPEYYQALTTLPYGVDDIYSIPVRHALLRRHGAGGEITEVVSQNTALEQCSNYLDTHHPHIPRVKHADTALSAQDLSEGRFPATAAVIASLAAAKRYRLDIVAENIPNDPYNETVFIAAKRS